MDATSMRARGSVGAGSRGEKVGGGGGGEGGAAGYDNNGEVTDVGGTGGSVEVVIKFRAATIKGRLSRPLSLEELRHMIGLPGDALITVIHKGRKLAQGDVLPSRPCSLLVIENSTACSVDDATDGTTRVCPTWLRSWIPTPIRSVADSVLGVAASTVGAVVSAVAGRDAHVRGEDENDPHIPRDGERVQLEVTFVADSATAASINVRWSAGSCGQLLEPSCELFEGFARGDRLTATQTVLSNGCAGEVVCTITDDTSTVTKRFPFTPPDR